MALDRNANVDNRKRGPADTKALVSEPVTWPTSMGAWDAPAVMLWTDQDPDGDGDESYESENPGTDAYNPISEYKPSDFSSRRK